MANLFTTAATVAPKPKASKAKQREVIQVEGLEAYSAVDAFMKTLEGLKEQMRAKIEATMVPAFIKNGMSAKKRPENLEGEDGLAVASLQLKKRSVRSSLTEEEVALLAEHKIETETNVVVPAAFIVNQKYSDLSNPNNAKLLEDLSKVMEPVLKKAGIDDFFQQQAEVSSTVVPEKGLDEIFQRGINDASVVEQLLATVGVLGVRPKLNTQDFDQVAAILKKAGVTLGSEKKAPAKK